MSVVFISYRRLCLGSCPTAVRSSCKAKWQRRRTAALRKFKYSCNLDPRCGAAVGAVIAQTGPALATHAESKLVEDPDLGYVSPSACESGALVALPGWPELEARETAAQS